MKTSHRRLVMRTVGIVFAISLSVGLVFTGVGLNGRSNVLTARAASPNLVKNADFESGTNDWFAWAGGAATGNSVVHTGGGALAMGPGMQGEAQNLTLAPNTIYALSGWGRTTGTGEFAQITLRVTDGGGSSVDYQMPFSLSDWTRQARTITTPATLSSVTLYVMKNAGSGYFYADDISVAAGRDVQAWPFSEHSIWNTPLGSNANYTSVPFQLETAFISDDEPVVYADTNAPWRNAYTAGGSSANDFGLCNQDSAQGSVGVPQGSLQLPDSYTIDNWTRSPNFTPNNASWFFQGDGRTVAQFQPTARCNAAGPIFGYRTTDLDLYGDGIDGGHYGSGLASAGGGVRTGEMIGPGAIHHALQLDYWMAKNASNAPGFRWPADRADYGAATNYCSQDPCKSNPSAFVSFVQGSLLAVPPGATEASLGIKTAAGKKIFHALQDYGGYIVDDTGWYNQAVGVEYGVNNEMQGAYGYNFNVDKNATGAGLDWYNDLYALFSQLKVVDNNGPGNIGGGGTARAAAPPAFVSDPPPAPVALDRTGWTVNASINNGDAAKILDGSNSTYWRTGVAQAQGQNFVVDLQTAQTFNRVEIDATANAPEFAQGYEVDVSNDGSTWTQVHAATGTGTSATLGTFPTQTARYIRIQLTGGSISGASWSVGDFNVYQTNVVNAPLNRQAWNVSASSSCCGDVPAKAIDGNTNTRWSTGQAQTNGQTFRVDLGSTQTFSKLVLDSSHDAGDYARGYIIFASNDPNSWGSSIAACDNCSSNPVQTITFSSQTARYLTIMQTQSAGNWWSIDELRLYP